MATDISQIIIEFVASFLGGILVGALIEHWRFKRALEVERVKRLAPLLETCCPIIERIFVDSEYALNVLNRGGEADVHLDSQIDKVFGGLQQFQDWHSLLEQKGMKYELEKVDTELHDRLAGLFTFARLANKHGADYISQNLSGIQDSARLSKSKLKRVL